MKKLAIFFLLALLSLTMLVQTGCSSDTTTDDTDPIVIDIDITNLGLETVEIDSFDIEGNFPVFVQLTGLTENYSQLNFYLGTDTNPVVSLDKAELALLAETTALDISITRLISTLGYPEGDIDLRVEAVGTNFATDEVTIPIYLREPGPNSEWIDIEIILPENPAEYDIGDIIEIQIEMLGNSTMFKSFDAYLDGETTPFFTATTFDTTFDFTYETENKAIGSYIMNFEVTDIYDVIKRKTLNFTLKEFIPTFDITDAGGTGYELKSIVQTYDGGYLTVASDSILGTRVAKYAYNKENEAADQLWAENIGADVGIAESIVEDREYDGGVVIAGWRDNGTDIDTWARKVNSEDGSLIWNKHYGLTGIDDGGTVIRKSIDDGFIIGGYSLNPLGVEEMYIDTTWVLDSLGIPTDSVDFIVPGPTWETGYDVRLIKVYSNGNVAWNGAQNSWRDITGHGIYIDVGGVLYVVDQWVKKMGDQFITDLVVKDDGTILTTGWQNFRLYDGNVPETDMFFAEFDSYGNYNKSTTWSRMSDFDNEHHALKDYLDPLVNISWLTSRSLGSKYENESGFGITESHGGYSGDVIMVGETYQEDDAPVKAKLFDAWIVEFLISGDDDGALWEYSFGDAEKNEKAFGIDQTKDDGYIVTGYGTESDKQTWTFKLSKELFFVWSKKYDTAGDDWGVKALQCRDGGYMTGGNVGTGSAVRARLIKINKLGEENE
ncbi:MAG: hypothetical protein PF574_10390 [Candidatus Delongbacteria bacterium]|jgi:hypothetical protein|nr:hypothetical protein [Candidatus Delongbacteria bacterium]